MLAKHTVTSAEILSTLLAAWDPRNHRIEAMSVRGVLLAAAMALMAGCSEISPFAEGPARDPDVLYVPTPQPVVGAMLEMAEIESGDVLYDLGSGDGRIPITAARQYGIRAVGIEIDPRRVAEAQRSAKEAGVDHLVTFHVADLFETDLSEASVVTLYLLSTLNLRLRPKLLAELEPGSRIVSQSFSMGDWTPEQRRTVQGRPIYRWTVPASSTLLQIAPGTG